MWTAASLGRPVGWHHVTLGVPSATVGPQRRLGLGCRVSDCTGALATPNPFIAALIGHGCLTPSAQEITLDGHVYVYVYVQRKQTHDLDGGPSLRLTGASELAVHPMPGPGGA